MCDDDDYEPRWLPKLINNVNCEWLPLRLDDYVLSLQVSESGLDYNTTNKMYNVIKAQLLTFYSNTLGTRSVSSVSRRDRDR